MSIEGKQERQPLRVEIEEASSDDVDGLEEVYRESWMQTYPNEEAGITREALQDRLAEVYSPDTRNLREIRLSAKPVSETHLVAKVNGKVVGSCRVARAGAQTRSGLALKDRNELMSLYVHPDYQGKGIGTRLWQEAKLKLDQEKDTVLGVATYNERAIAFYKALGFEETEVDLTSETFRLSNGAIIPQHMMILRANMNDI